MGSTGSQARLIQSSHAPATYQPVLVKDLGKSQSPSKDINVVEPLDNRDDDEHKLTDNVMDKQLTELEADGVSRATICDIVQYMANLKEKHMESERLETQQAGQSAMKATPPILTSESSTEATNDPPNPSSDSSTTQLSSEEEMSMVVIDAKVDKVFKSEKPGSKIEQVAKKANKSPRSSICLSRSPDRVKSSGSSPIKIIKIKSPRSSVDAGKRLSVSISRDNSKERSPDRHRSISPRRSSEGGILKPFLPNSKTDPILTAGSSGTSSGGGILKRNTSPCSKSRSPERTHAYRKSLSPCTSFDSRSPDRNRLSPHSSFDRRSPDRKTSPDGRYADYSTVRGCMYRSPRSSFESRSPDRKRSLSAHSSFEKSKSPEPYYHHYYSSPHAYHSPERPGKRQSKSLERQSSRDSSSSYQYGLSPERIYRIGPTRSQSAENALRQSGRPSHELSNEFLNRFLEQPTCVDCLYQRKTVTGQPKGRQRQSRARKKIPRGHPSLERTQSIDTADGCVDCHEHYEIHV